VFINSPENVQHVCATNVKNYNMRYLPVSKAYADNLYSHVAVSCKQLGQAQHTYGYTYA
jgi:hypothetical protein